MVIFHSYVSLPDCNFDLPFTPLISCTSTTPAKPHPQQLQINYISENHQNPRPNSHQCLENLHKILLFDAFPHHFGHGPNWPNLSFSGSLPGPCSAPAVSWEGARWTRPAAGRSQWSSRWHCNMWHLRLRNQWNWESSFCDVFSNWNWRISALRFGEIWIPGSQRARVMGRATIPWQYIPAGQSPGWQGMWQKIIDKSRTFHWFDCHTARRYLYY